MQPGAAKALAKKAFVVFSGKASTIVALNAKEEDAAGRAYAEPKVATKL